MKAFYLAILLFASNGIAEEGRDFNKDGKLPLTSVKWGGSGCKSLETWQQAVDALLQNNAKKSGEILNSCKWIERGSAITGPIETVEYKGNKFEKFSHPLWGFLWIEPSAYK